eukprot:scaffold4613_cov129-Isochrysis_galbana.AAC.31
MADERPVPFSPTSLLVQRPRAMCSKKMRARARPGHCVLKREPPGMQHQRWLASALAQVSAKQLVCWVDEDGTLLDTVQSEVPVDVLNEEAELQALARLWHGCQAPSDILFEVG